jgi:RimJ/RimL family protein N-acetyltransferase
MVEGTLLVDEHVALVPLRIADAEAYVPLVRENAQRLARWFPWAQDGGDPVAIRAFLVTVEQQRTRAERNETYAIVVDGAFAGALSLHDEDMRNDCAELGYWIGERFGGRGVMTRSARALCAHAFGRGLHRLEIVTGVENAPSRALAERAGFRFEGVLRGRVATGRGYEDAALYARLAGDP